MSTGTLPIKDSSRTSAPFRDCWLVCCCCCRTDREGTLNSRARVMNDHESVAAIEKGGPRLISRSVLTARRGRFPTKISGKDEAKITLVTRKETRVISRVREELSFNLLILLPPDGASRKTATGNPLRHVHRPMPLIYCSPLPCSPPASHLCLPTHHSPATTPCQSSRRLPPFFIPARSEDLRAGVRARARALTHTRDPRVRS